MKNEAVDLVRRALAGRMPILVVRGVDAMARPDGDIDILVPGGRATEAALASADAARPAGWLLLGISDIDYLVSVVLVRARDGSSDEAVKLDFWSGFTWYGAGTDEVARRFFELQTDGSRSERQWAALATLLQKLVVVGRLSSRDRDRVHAGATDVELLAMAAVIGLRLTAADLAPGGIGRWRKWRLRAAMSAARTPWQIVRWFMEATLAHLRFKSGFGTGSGELVALSGLDGVGKSSQFERLLAAYRTAGWASPYPVHLLPRWIPMPHQLLRRRRTRLNYQRPYLEAPVKSHLGGGLRLAWYLCAFGLAKAWMRWSVSRGRVIVLDRSFVDFAADLTRARIPDWRLPAPLLRACAPSGLLLYLDASAETVVHRKAELGVGKAEQLRRRYLTVIDPVGGTVVDAEGTQEAVFASLLERLDASYRRRLEAKARR
ncbi:MAG: hypothetical protein H3C59_01570 [Burkholderiaceae bacterium]|nr:hypothetical protein [Burkholderiaceae bacterium]